MKKPYVKPQLYYENFELSQHVAACGWDMRNQADKSNCTALGDKDWGNEPVYLFTETSRCEVTEDQVEGYCYENGTDFMRVFNS